jgi:predicted dehydrogenase
MSAMRDPLPELDVGARLPRRMDRGIGIVGAGAIVVAGHLPAYRRAGFNVVAIADIDHRAAQRVASEWGIPRAYASADALLEDRAVEIVDIAVTPSAQPPIAAATIASGRDVLCQKPLALDIETATTLVRDAERAGLRLAVNQQMRWEPVIRATKLLLADGRFGEPAGALYDIDIGTPWENWPWLAALAQLEYRNHSIHYLDSARYLFGDPVAVVASIARFPGQASAGETRTFTILEYSDTLAVALLVNHNNWSRATRALVRCEGTQGRSEGRLGLFEDYPVGGPHSLSFVSRADGEARSRTFEQRWFPDAFAGPMAELLCAIEEEREPLTCGRDNLGTLALVEAAYLAAAEGGRVRLQQPAVLP